MAYIKNNWVDQSVERPKTYEMTNNADGSVTLIDSFGLVSELGTPVNADNMNHIEEGIAGCDLRKHNLTETFGKGEWVTGIVEDVKGIYESLTDNNYGNPLTDGTKWKKVELGGGSTSLPLFTPVIQDHILSFEESKGFALQGTYVYKTGVAGSRYGYPEFIQKCIDEFKNTEPYSITAYGDWITLPTFTSNTTDGITISDSRNNTTVLQTMFNNGTTQTPGSNSAGHWSTYWLNIDYGQPTVLENYKITSDDNGSSEYPSAWTIQGSNDGVNFDVLGSVTDYTFGLNDIRTFSEGVSFQQTKPYSQYRLVFSAGVEYNNSGEIGGITFNAKQAKVVNVKKNPDGHLFYDIADKNTIDEFYNFTGVAWFYGVDKENERVFLPRNDWYFKLNGKPGYIPAGIPNFKATIQPIANKWTGSRVPEYINTKGITRTEVGSGVGYSGGSAYIGGSKYDIDLSDYNPIFGGNKSVQPPSAGGYLYILVGNTSQITHVSTTIPEAEILSQVNKNTSDILNKVNLDGSNAEFPYIKESYVNGTSGYNVYSNGYCEQWGRVTGYNIDTTITFLKPFRDANYNITQAEIEAGGQDSFVNGYRFINLTAKFMVCSMRNDATKTCSWRACGYLAEGEY